MLSFWIPRSGYGRWSRVLCVIYCPAAEVLLTETHTSIIQGVVMWQTSLTMAARKLLRATVQWRAPVIPSIFAEVHRCCSSTFGMAPLTHGMHPRILVAMRYSLSVFGCTCDVERAINLVPRAWSCTPPARHRRYKRQGLLSPQGKSVSVYLAQKLNRRIRARLEPRQEF